ncbi:MAG: hypothetical protein ABJN75_03555 [Hoeflea sp.]
MTLIIWDELFAATGSLLKKPSLHFVAQVPWKFAGSGLKVVPFRK